MKKIILIVVALLSLSGCQTSKPEIKTYPFPNNGPIGATDGYGYPKSK